MANMVIKVSNVDFYADLCEQAERYLPDFKLMDENADVGLIDDINDYKELRIKNKNLPIIFLSSEKEQINDSLCVLMRKPVKLSELLDTLKSVIARMENTEAGYLHFNEYELRPNVKELVDLQKNITIKLTEKEVSILKYLYKSKDNFVGKIELQKNVWQYNGDVSTHTIETHIYRLRQKVEQKSKRAVIVTNKGGYKLKTEL